MAPSGIPSSPDEKDKTTAAVLPSSPSPGYTDAPPRYPSTDVDKEPSRANPKTWGWKIWLTIVVAIIVVVVAATVGGVLGVKANAYPDYSKLNYKLVDTYSGSDFFSNFDFFTGYDPTHGFVHYVDAQGSNTTNLTSISSSSSTTTAILRVDTSDKNATTGRRSVRITSKKTYSTGLFIFDILHTPYGCATWPALWLTDPANWPDNGEIDVVEAVNMGDSGNQVTLHTSKNCKIGKHRKRKQTGKALSYDCYNMTNSNEGCGVQGPVNSFGKQFNDNGGGVYAMELRSQGIRVWMFPRSNIPSDISSIATNSSSVPDPSTWSTPLADFPNLECNIGSHFKNQSIIANIDLCGDWAGRTDVFDQGQCSGTCSDWVALNASSFQEAYWEFGGWWVYGAA